VAPIQPPDVSERSWLNAVVTVGGFLLALVGIAALISDQPLILLGVATGASSVLSIVLWALYGALRRQQIEERTQNDERIRRLEVDLLEARRQAGEWSATSNNISNAARAVIDLAGSAPTTAPARVPRVRKSSGDKAE
jgi:hypothetical protein